MSLCAQTDVIFFEHSGAPKVRYNGTFHSSSDKYKVAMSIVENTQDKKLKDILNSANYRQVSSQQFNLTISCMKFLHRFIQVKVYEVRTERILFEKSFDTPFFSKRGVFLINVENKPAMFVIRIISSEDIIELKKIIPVFLMTESDSSAKKELETLSTDMKNLIENNTFSDVTVTDGDNKMHLHKAILSARSPVFEKMFQCQMKENLEGLVTIKDIPFDVLKVLVSYMYSGDINIESMHMARALYYAADKYDVQNLKKICLSKLQSMKLNDVLGNLILADMHGEVALKEQALNLITKNYLTVGKLESWSIFKTENEILDFEILNFIIKKNILNMIETYETNILKIDARNDVPKIKKICLSKLRSLIIDDILDNLILRDTYDETALKKQALNFVANNFSIVVEHRWGEFMKENYIFVFKLLHFKLKIPPYKV